MSDWTEYSEKRPEVAGVYEWSIPSNTMPGECIVVAAHMRLSGAYQDVLSPSFDKWDGYRVLVPKGTKWRECREGLASIKWHEEVVVGVEGRELRACEFCGETPKIKAYRKFNDGSISLTPCPSALNDFNFTCCWNGRIKNASSIMYAESERAANFLKSDAPALLDALEHIVSRYESLVHDLFDGTSTVDSRLAEADKARALIAKHRGGA